jgi:alkylation response protein AidB-like acyl-CoA dehydrogenase
MHGVQRVFESEGDVSMKPIYNEEADLFRAQIKSFLSEHLPADWNGIGALSAEEAHQFSVSWRATLADNKLLAPDWPAEYGGGGMTELQSVVMMEEFLKAGVPAGGENDPFSIQMVGNTILLWGTEEQKQHFLPRIISGEDIWCQGYSEPNAGSDLGNLGCKADLDGDEWVINGQKIWTSAGHLANWIFVLGRTDPDVKKHRGITFLLVPMDQPGIEVRPIEMITGQAEFNEVFFTDARTAKENVVGEVNGGWGVAMTLLGFERGEAAAKIPIEFRYELDKLVDLARQRGLNNDPLIRQRIARCYEQAEIMRYLGMRTLTRFLAGEHPGPDGSIFKLYWSELHKIQTELAIDILGADGMHIDGKLPNSAFGPDQPGAANDSGSWIGAFLNARAGTIYAGTSQVQRNILGEMVLGLPKEPRADSGAWKDIPK